jgi:hypothetical protein
VLSRLTSEVKLDPARFELKRIVRSVSLSCQKRHVQWKYENAKG